MSAEAGGQSDVVITWVAACMGKRGNAYNIFVGRYEGQDHKEDRGIGGRVKLKGVLREQILFSASYMECREN